VVFLANSGAEAVEAAIKLARYHTKRPRCRLYGGFHGRTKGSSLRRDSQRKGSSRLAGQTHLLYPDPPMAFAFDATDVGHAALDYRRGVSCTTRHPRRSPRS
jgi:4-aminobutyrate aminotransferase